MSHNIKSSLSFCGIILLCFSLISIQAAIEDNEFVNNVEQGTKNLQNIADSANSGEYLKQEWAKVFENKLQQSWTGRSLLKINEIMKSLSPLFKNIIGLEYSFSWAFILGLIIWVTIALFLSSPLEELFNNKFFAIVSSFAIASLIGLSGIIKKTVDLLSIVITNKWIAWIAFIITLAIALIIIKLGKNIEKQIKNQKEREAKEKSDKDREILHIGAESVKEELEGYKKK